MSNGTWFGLAGETRALVGTAFHRAHRLDELASACAGFNNDSVHVSLIGNGSSMWLDAPFAIGCRLVFMRLLVRLKMRAVYCSATVHC